MEYPGLINPLDDYTMIAAPRASLPDPCAAHDTRADAAMMYQYYTKVVPTRYIKLNGAEVNTNQFSATTHQKPISAGEPGLPGVFFMFEPSPILVQLTERRRCAGPPPRARESQHCSSFLHFLTGVCAIIGGVFTGSQRGTCARV